MSISGLIVALVLVIVIPSISSAECAWVLWQKSKGTQYFETGLPVRSGTGWEVIGAHKTLDLCQKDKPREYEKMKTRFVEGGIIAKIDSINEESLVLHFSSGETPNGKQKGGWMELTLVCLSDAVDPRGK